MTAIQKAFSDLEKLQPHLFDIHTQAGREFVNHFHQYLKIEKQQIIEAQECGFTDGCRYTTGYEQTLWETGDDYYNEKYEKL